VTAPLVLAVETSGARSAVAVLEAGELLAEREFPRGSGGRGAGSPAAAAAEALRHAGRAPGAVELVAASVGPGSYTGLRVGVSFAKCFAWAVGAEVAAVSSLRALAAERAAGGALPEGTLLVPTGDAYRRQIYVRVFRAERGAGPRELTSDLVVEPACAADRLRAELGDLDAELLFFGDGAARYREVLSGSLAAAGLRAEIDDRPAGPAAATVGRLGLELLAAGKTVTAHDLVPVYLRKTEAEERLESGHRA
jgi:tRNA threonylcarbamoyladenosine biosynthesis protein TsaB